MSVDVDHAQSRRRLRLTRRLGAVGAVLAGSLASVLPVSAPTAAAASDDIVAIVIDGTGFGHGRGMSQWGAYGYAVDHGWDWNQILEHYYGGTESSTVPGGERIRVRLTDYDGMGTVGVVAYGQPVRWTDAGGNTFTRASMYARETAAGTFEIFGSTQRSCPGASTLVVPSGSPSIGIGSSNEAAVRQIQQFLSAYQTSNIAVDGDFGNQTRGYLFEWQDSEGLTLDGVWDEEDANRARAVIAADAGGTFTLLGTEVTGTGNPVSFTIANGDDSSIAPGNALAVCASNRTMTHYRGSIDVLSTSSGNRVVNDVEVEDYLRGVLPKEISASWANAGDGAGANAVRAQAVAARSYGLQQQRSYFYNGSSTRYASTCDTTSCQVYAGAATRSTAGSVRSVEHPLTDAAAVATAGVVRRWPAGHPKAGQLVSTEFSASNGPRTAGGEFPPVDDIGDDTDPNPNHRWTRVIDADELESRYGLGQMTSAEMVEAAESQYRVYDGIWFNDLVLTGEDGSQRTQAWDFRRSFNLPSPGFTVRVIRENTTSKSFGFIGDSVGESIGSGNAEFNRLIDGTFESATLSFRSGRCTVRSSCPGTSGVEQAALLPSGLDLVVVELGYNDSASTFAADIDAMMSTLEQRDVQRVAWVNMADIRSTSRGSTFGPMNAQLEAAANKWPTLSVLDWNAASDSAEARARWFSDGVHLTTTGQAEFALWLRAEVLELAPSHFLVPPKRLRIPVVGRVLKTPAGQSITVPATASSVALNVTTVLPRGPGVVSIWPCEAPEQLTSNLNNMGGDVVANNVIASIDSNGEICLRSTNATDVIVDVTGWFQNGAIDDGDGPGAGNEAAGVTGQAGALTSVSPTRIVDSRIGVGSPTRRLTSDEPLVIDVPGITATMPDGTEVIAPEQLSSVVINLTSVNAALPGFFTVWPCEFGRKVTSSLNYVPGRVVANGVLAAVDSNGQVCIHSSVPSDVVVDLQGWFGAAEPAFIATDPNRIVDTRIGLGSAVRPVGEGESITVPVHSIELESAGESIVVPDDATAAVLNVVAVGPDGGGHLTVWSCEGEVPLASNLNYLDGDVVANGVIAPIGSAGNVCVYTHATSDVVVDIGGWLTTGFVGVTPDRVVDTRFGVGPVPS